MSVYEDLPVREALEGAWSGIVATSPDSRNEVEVVIPAFDNQLRFQRCKWFARGNSTPQRGDECLVIFDEKRRPHIISWWSDDPAIGSIDGRTINWHEGSAPPASPQVNDLWLFHPTTGISWTFRYEPDQDGTYPWQFVGGPPHGAQLANDESPTLNSTWHDLPTVGPDITIARAGFYTIGYGFDTYDDGGGVGWSTVNAGPALGAGATPGVAARASVNPTSQIGSSPYAQWTFGSAIAAGQLVRMRYFVISGALASVQIRLRHMWVHPIRIA